MRSLAMGAAEMNLTQALKRAHVADSGGDAKRMISEGLVRVNGVIETRKRRQLALGDVIEVEGSERIQLVEGD